MSFISYLSLYHHHDIPVWWEIIFNIVILKYFELVGMFFIFWVFDIL